MRTVCAKSLTLPHSWIFRTHVITLCAQRLLLSRDVLLEQEMVGEVVFLNVAAFLCVISGDETTSCAYL